ncbi:MAG: nuclear transport factor 2 family protein [Acidimicrobiales bacterium]
MTDVAIDRVGDGAAADELAVRNVLGLMAQLADGPDVDAYVDLFTPDGSWEMPGAPRHGHDDIRAGSLARRVAGDIGPGSFTRHVVTILSVTVDGDVATADSVWQFFANTDTEPRVQLLGTYHDDLVRTPAGWKMARRRITMG